MDTSRLDEAIASFVEFIHSLPADALALSKTDRWGPREVLIHLVFWHEQYARIGEDMAAKRQPVMLRGTFKELNRTAVAENNSVPVETLIERWDSAHKRFVHVAKMRNAHHLKFSLREKSKQWPMADIIRLAAGHIQNHQSDLRIALGVPKPRKSSAAAH